jgi:hypothetical protein
MYVYIEKNRLYIVGQEQKVVIGGISLPKVLKNVTNHMFSV